MDDNVHGRFENVAFVDFNAHLVTTNNVTAQRAFFRIAAFHEFEGAFAISFVRTSLLFACSVVHFFN
jgi:hypothetical protein